MQGDCSMKKGMAAAVVIGTALGMFGWLAAPSTATIPEAVVTRDQYGANWPWPKFERGIIRCKDDQVTIAMGPGPVIYGLNGRALSRGRYSDHGQFLKRQPGTEDISDDGRGISHSGALRATSELIQLGLRLCAQQGR
jgi:hypothetical protein